MTAHVHTVDSQHTPQWSTPRFSDRVFETTRARSPDAIPACAAPPSRSLQPNHHNGPDGTSVAPGAGQRPVHHCVYEQPGGTEVSAVALPLLLPLWNHWWLISCATLIVLAAVYGMIRRKVVLLRGERHLHQHFSGQLIASQEQERKRIASELHDSIGQNILIIKNRASLGLESCPLEHPARKELQIISDLSSQTISDLREIAYNLRPYQLDRLGLTQAVRSLGDRTNEMLGVRVDGEFTDIDHCLGKEDEVNIFRIVQEGLSNVVKHAQAEHVTLTMRKNDNAISIRLADDGGGFDEREVASRSPSQGAFGLRNIRERVRMLRGTISIQSSPGRGTVLDISIPCRHRSGG